MLNAATRILLVVSILVLAGCSTPSPYGVYSRGHAFWGESIEVNQDGTFEYGSASDDFSEHCTVHGSWALDDKDKNVVVLTVEETIKGDYSESCDDKPHHKKWRVRSSGLVSASKLPYRAKLERQQTDD